ncbi:hypothetical protein [Actinoplanes sp. N902-109]|uniref:hypothetical protein n=1 Tax=Actinoplanes sp. (strain N902-109) TaxID=649831 RepID=UPI0003296506|nr:hypothetical protein [Actinoplanes sp. N902-109]AGL17986.1 hypothetical protein L083_4476 [Actinoplanes sp. N902-109]
MTDPTEPGDLSPDDGPLLARLEAMFREADPAPSDLVTLAKESFILRALDAELAQLVEDSDTSAAEPAASRAMAVRGAGTVPHPRQLTFQVVDEQGRDEVVIAVQVEAAGSRRRLTGHLAPQGPATIEVRQPAADQPRRTEADARGLFIIDDVLPGPMSLTLHRPGAAPVATQWTLV